MGEKRKPRGLQLRDGIWHIDKVVLKVRICESTGTSDLNEAERVLARRIDEIRQQKVFGVRPRRCFRDAATKYLRENTHKRSIERDARALKDMDPFLGDLPIDRVHWDALQPYARARTHLKQGTLNRHFAVVRRILNLAARVWRDENGMTWLETAPLLQLPKAKERPAYPMSWDEQRLLFGELAAHLATMALFKVNTGCREDEVCGLRWEYEQKLSESCSVFVIPGDDVKNTLPRVVVLNDVAQSIIETQRGKHPEFVFVYTRREKRRGVIVKELAPIDRMNNSGWKAARRRAAKRYKEEFEREAPEGFRRIRVHDMKHTFGRRLRAAGVSFEDRQDLLGHKSARITTHYSAAEISNLKRAANLVNEKRESSHLLLRVIDSRKSHA